MKIILKALAKVNLTLEVIRRLPNGYHELRSVSCKLSKFYDEVIVETVEGSRGIEVKSCGINIPRGRKNICFTAAERYLKVIKKEIGLKINIQKNIPVAAGLGGGSSDAAAVLLALNKIFKYALSSKKLIKLGAGIGKDVPWFLLPHRVVYKRGMGEKVVPVAKNFSCHFVVVNPKIEVITKKAFGTISGKLRILNNKARVNKSKNIISGIERERRDLILSNLYNDFELIQEAAHPVIKEIKQNLLAFGADGALMSGSGPTVFGLFFSKKDAQMAHKNLKKLYRNFVIHSE